MSPHRFAVVALVTALFAPAVARADPWHLTVSAGTDFPIAAGARVDVEGPLRLRLSTSVGVMPGAYVDAINAIGTSAGWYTDSEAQLIRTALRSSFVWRTHVGWRPWPRLPLTVMAGYGLVTLGGGASAQELIAGVTGATIPPGTGSGTYSYAVRSTLHMVDVEVGWSWRFFSDRLEVSACVGFAGTASSHTTITPQYTPRNPNAAAAFTNYGAQYLDDTLQSYVFTPVLSLWAGWRVF